MGTAVELFGVYTAFGCLVVTNLFPGVLFSNYLGFGNLWLWTAGLVCCGGLLGLRFELMLVVCCLL